MLERVDNFPKTTELSLFNCYPSYMLGTCGDGSIDVKSKIMEYVINVENTGFLIF